MKNLYYIVAALIGIISCGTDDEIKSTSGVAVNAPFLKLADFTKPSNTSTLEKSSVLLTLKDDDHIYANKPDKEESGTNSDNDDNSKVTECLDQVFSELKINASGELLTIGAELNSETCLKSAFDQSSESILKIEKLDATVRFYLSFKCSGADLSLYHGKSFKDIEHLDVEENCTSMETLSNSMVVMSTVMEFEFEGVSKKIESSSTLKSFSGSTDMNPCLVQIDNQLNKTSDNCTYIEVSTSSSSIDGVKQDDEINFLKLLPKNLTTLRDKTSQWHTSGTIDFEVNSWTGTLTFGGADLPPEYQLLDSSGESSTGALNISSHIYKKSSILRFLSRSGKARR